MPRRDTNGEKDFYARGWKEWKKELVAAAQRSSEGQVCEMVKLKLVHRHWGPRKIRRSHDSVTGAGTKREQF